MSVLTTANKQSKASTVSRQPLQNRSTTTLQRKLNDQDTESLTKIISNGTPVNSYNYPSVTHENSQSSHLNRLVQRSIVQIKLTVGKPNDRFEREADQMANKVMTSSPTVIHRLESDKEEEAVQTNIQRKAEEEEEPVQKKLQTFSIQRQAEEEKEEPVQTKSLIQRQVEEKEEEAQAKPLIQTQEEEKEGEPVQEKLQAFSINRQADEKEKPIQTQSLIQKQVEEEEEEPVQTKSLLQKQEEEKEKESVQATIQREADEEEEESVQAKMSAGGTVKSGLQSRLSNTKGLGEPLPDTNRSFMEPHFGSDFGDVKVHTGSDAVRMSKELNAQAFTHGSDIYFNEGKYNTGTSSGKHLLAHELTHVVQQGGAARTHPVQMTQAPRKIQRLFDPVGNLLNKLARHIPGYTLITVILGRNPLTDEAVPRTAKNLVGGFLGLIPGGTVLFNRLNEAGAIDEALTWLQDRIKILDISWSGIKSLISEAWDRVSIWNSISENLGIIKKVFAPTFNRIMRFVASIGKKIMEFIFRGALKLVHAPVDKIMGILNKGKAVFIKIISNPIGFVKNLVSAVVLGIKNFSKNIFKHLKKGISGWLFGALGDLDIQLPKKFDLKGVFFLVAQILGLTYKNIRAKIVKKLGPKGEQIVTGIEKGVVFVKDLITRGPIVIWEKIKGFLANLKDIVFGAIKDWVVKTIVVKAIEKLVSFFNPAGAIIQAVIAIYNTIMFFIERIKQIADFVESVINSIAAIASGVLGKAAAAVENAMSRTLPIIISFLARLIGLGGITKKIQEIIKKIRKPIDKALDKIIGWIVRKAKALFVKGKAGVAKGIKKVASFFVAPFQMGGNKHQLVMKDTGGKSTINMQSTPGNLTSRIEKAVKRTTNKDAKERLMVLHSRAQEIENGMARNLKGRELTRYKQKLVSLSMMIQKFGADYNLQDLFPVNYDEHEGDVGTYGELKGKGEKMTPDHEPQNSVLVNIKKIKFEDGRKLFKGTEIMNYSTRKGICLNMKRARHLETRTYGSKGGDTKKAAFEAMHVDISTFTMKNGSSIGKGLEYVKNAVKSALQQDQDRVQKIYDDKKWNISKKTREKVKASNSKIKSMNLSKWPQIF